MPMTSPRGGPKCDFRSWSYASSRPPKLDVPVPDRDGVFADGERVRRHPSELVLDVPAGLHDGVPHEHGRTAGRRRRIEWHDRRVAHHDRDALGRNAQFLRRDLLEDGSRALAHVRGAGQHGGAAIVVETHDRERCRGGCGALQPERNTAPAQPGHRLMPSNLAGRVPERALPFAVSRCIAGNERFSSCRNVAQADLDRIDPELRGRGVELRLDGPGRLRRSETRGTPCLAWCATGPRAR